MNPDEQFPGTPYTNQQVHQVGMDVIKKKRAGKNTDKPTTQTPVPPKLDTKNRQP